MKQLNYDYLESDLIDKYIRVMKREIDSFKQGTVGMVDLNAIDGIWALVGVTVGDENRAIYSYLFEKKQWTEQGALEWVDTAEKTGEIISKSDNGESLIIKISDLLNDLMDKVSPEESLDVYADLKDLKGVEIFQAGKWNGDFYSLDDLKEIVNSFGELKEKLQPFVKLGHNESQPLLAKDGFPAAGWIDNVYIQGNKLLADIKDMPSVIYELVKNKAYKRISSEIYWNLKDSSGKIYKRALKAIALLGGDTPAVGSLADVQALYSKREVGNLDGEVKIAEIQFYTKEDIMDIEQIKADYEAKIAELTATKEAVEKSYSELEDSMKEMKTSKTELESKIAEYELKSVRSGIESKVDELIASKKLLPAQREYAIETLIGQVEVKSYSEDSLNENPMIKMFENGADVVDTDEKTEENAPKGEDEVEAKKAEEIKEAASYEEAKKIYMGRSK